MAVESSGRKDLQEDTGYNPDQENDLLFTVSD